MTTDPARTTTSSPRRPFDDAAARSEYLHWLALHAESESPYFRERWAELRRDASRNCYLGFLTFPALELRRRGIHAPAPCGQAVAQVIASIPGRVHKNWTLPILIWWLYRYSGQFTEEQLAAIRTACIETKFWMHDPGEDQDCYFTENHQLIFHVDELLIGSAMPATVMPVTGREGSWHADRATRALERWFDWRAAAGFSEFKSYGYSDAILFALLTLREFSPVARLAARADALIDIVLAGYAHHAFQGDLACAQGRSAFSVTCRGDEWMASVVGSILWGRGERHRAISAAAILLACSGYQVPAAIQAIALHDRPQVHRERESLDAAEAACHGIDPGDDVNAMFFWGSQQYCHPATIDASLRTVPWPGYYMAPRIRAWDEQHRLDRLAGRPPAIQTDHTALGRAEQYAWRTPETKISSALDYQAGQPGHDQHPWLASLGGKAVCFSHHPASLDPFGRPGYWGGGHGVLPRVAQHLRTLVSIHRIMPQQSSFLTTHAYVPRFACDEWIEDSGWVFLRRGDGYLAIRSILPARWLPADPRIASEIYRYDTAGRERVMSLPYEWEAPGHANVFICEAGRRADDGDFTAFVGAIAKSRVHGDWQELIYASPFAGEVRFGWTGPLTVGGRTQPLRSGLRLDSPHGTVPFGSPVWELAAGGHRHRVDLSDGTRAGS